MTDEHLSRVQRPVRRPATAVAVVALLMSAVQASAQDTTSVVKVRGVRVEVPRPSTTTGGTSAVEISLDSAGVVAAPTMEDVLRRTPFIQIRANSRGEAQPDLRGAGDRQIAILLNGIPVTIGWDHRTDISAIPLTAFRNVTLLRGLSSMLHGPNVLGGAIEFDVGRGDALQTVPPFVGEISIDQEGATNASAAVGATIDRDFANWTVRTGAGYRNSPGYTLPGSARNSSLLRQDLLGDADGRRLNSDNRLVDGFLTTRYMGIGGAWFSSLVTASDAERGVPPEAHVDDPRLWRYPSQSRLFIAMSGGTGQRQSRLGEGDVEASFGLHRSTVGIDEYATADYRTVVDGETGETLTLTGRLLGDHRFETGPEVRSALTFSDVSHTEAFQSGSSFDYEQRLWSLGSEIEFVGGGPEGTGTVDTRWTLGASVDGSSTPRSGDKEPLEAMWDWGMRTGVTRSGAGGNILYHAGLSRRTRFPSLRELYSGALGRFQPNPGLRPENLKAGEAGITFSAGDTQLQMVGFHHRLSDGIVRTSTVTTEGARFQRVNRDEIRSTGVEVLTAGTRGVFTFGGGLTLQRVRIQDPQAPGNDQRAEYTPAVTGTMNLGLIGPQDVTITSFVRFRGVQYCQNVEVAGLARMDASATLSLEARRGFVVGRGSSGRSVAGSVGFDNLTDAMVLDQCGLPQPGRTFRIQFSVR